MRVPGDGRKLAHVHGAVGSFMCDARTRTILIDPAVSCAQGHRRMLQAVVTWTHQIKNVLKMDPEAALKTSTHVGPAVEIDFWKARVCVCVCRCACVSSTSCTLFTLFASCICQATWRF